ncbi:MAG TPA: DUF2807 domain-containing protein [Rhizomicrobium sp.]|jgi:hypothetical protein|nr:DUF2807 domain-containing protein [Rhizomicrobium sp.]
MKILPSLLFAATIAVPFAASAQTVIPVAPFKSVGLSGGGQVTLHSGPVQRVVLTAGSTQYTSFRNEDGNLSIDACNSSCPSGEYVLRIDITTPDIEGVAVEGGGGIIGDAGLPAHKLDAAVSGGGHIDMRAVHADAVNAAVDGGGHIQVYAQSSLHAAVSGGGRIEYWGHPHVDTAISGGGDVRSGS